MADGQASQATVDDWKNVSGAPQDDWQDVSGAPIKTAPAAAPAAAAPSTYSRLTAGYNPNVEDWAAKHPILGPAARFLDAAGGAIIAGPEAAYEGIRHPIESAKSVASSLNAYNPWNPNHITASGAMSVLPEALGVGAGSVAEGEAVKSLPKIAAPDVRISSPREAIAKKLYDPQTGKLRPRLQEATSIWGVGGPARSAIKTAFPEPEEQVIGRAQGQALNENAIRDARAARALPPPPKEPPFEPFKPSERVAKQIRYGGPYEESTNAPASYKVTTGQRPASMAPLIAAPNPVPGTAAAPFEPLVWESPEEAAAHDLRMKNIERQAKSAGKYHAAQGASGKRTNLQQRIAKKES